MGTVSIERSLTGTPLDGVTHKASGKSGANIIGDRKTTVAVTDAYAVAAISGNEEQIRGAVVVNLGDKQISVRVKRGTSNPGDYDFFPLPPGRHMQIFETTADSTILVSSIEQIALACTTATETSRAIVHIWW